MKISNFGFYVSGGGSNSQILNVRKLSNMAPFWTCGKVWVAFSDLYKLMSRPIGCYYDVSEWVFWFRGSTIWCFSSDLP